MIPRTTAMARRGERGDAALELVLLAPVLLLIVAFVVFCGRLSSVQVNAHAAAADGARAASIRADPATADVDARATVSATLAHDNISCSRLDVSVDTSDFRPGGSVTVDVTCTMDNSDLAVTGIPGSRTVHARAIAVIDQYLSR